MAETVYVRCTYTQESLGEAMLFREEEYAEALQATLEEAFPAAEVSVEQSNKPTVVIVQTTGGWQFTDSQGAKIVQQIAEAVWLDMVGVGVEEAEITDNVRRFGHA